MSAAAFRQAGTSSFTSLAAIVTKMNPLCPFKTSYHRKYIKLSPYNKTQIKLTNSSQTIKGMILMIKQRVRISRNTVLMVSMFLYTINN